MTSWNGVRRRVVLLGSTGSIGRQAIEVLREHPERFEVVGLAAGSDVGTLASQADALGVDDLAIVDADAARRLRELRPGAAVRDGAEGVEELAALPGADLVLNGIEGSAGLAPTLAALHAGHRVALANKESLVIGGPVVVAAAAGRDDALVPVDSEHSALAQCLRGSRRDEVQRLLLTASGGPFHGMSRAELEAVSVEDALAHPTWSMGRLITINSATLMNKGLELIEAQLLFGIAWDALDVVVHPQSVVHSMVEFVDGSTLAQLSPPDMRLPIQLALSWPERLPHAFTRNDWTTASELTFVPVDRASFPALALAEAAGRRGGTYPAALNAANERAVAAFIDHRIGFVEIPAVTEEVLAALDPADGAALTLEEVLAADRWARARADEIIARRR
jgi:1-deoxy-D-xylulose-5-phosphate reductoisomerase